MITLLCGAYTAPAMGGAAWQGKERAPAYKAEMQLPAIQPRASAGGGAVANGGFETGDFTSWIATDIGGPFVALGVGGAGFTPGFGLFTSAPTEGTFAALHGFDGAGPDTISLAQDVSVPASPATTRVVFDYRAGWDFFSGSLDRTFEVVIEPSGGGAPLQTDLILTTNHPTDNLDTGPLSGSVDLSAFAGSTIRVNFLWTILESFTGPGLFQLDNVRLLICGDGQLDPGEECDDGNNTSFDGCSDVCENEQPQSKTQQGCIVDMNKNVAKVAKAQGKDICKCIKDGAKGKLGGQTIEECLTSDGKGKVDKAKKKLEAKVAKSCTTDPNSPAAPDFGAETPPDPDLHSQAAIEAQLGLIHWIFGSDLDAVIVKQNDPNVPNAKENSKCQIDVAKGAKKCFDTKWKIFNKCKKDALKGKTDPPVGNATQLAETCLGTGTDPIPDPGGKVQKACDTKLGGKINSKCAPPVDLALAFPDYDPNASDLRSFIDFMVECEFCEMVNKVDGLSRDCDLFDDGVENNSCGCGNGVLDPGEGCDDGNMQDGDGCSAKCLVEFCGDGFLNNAPNEECDSPDDSACPGLCGTDCSCGPPCTEDPSRTTFAGGPGAGLSGGACQQFGDQASCEDAWHETGFNEAASCNWSGSGCHGCGPPAMAASVCTNTCSCGNGVLDTGEDCDLPDDSACPGLCFGCRCVPPCANDPSRTTFAGGPGAGLGGGACIQFGDQTSCEDAWHQSGPGEGTSCFWDGSFCLGCGPVNDGFLCTDTCSFAPPSCTTPEDLTPCSPAVTDTWTFSVSAGQTVEILADTVDAPTAADLFFSGDCGGVDFFGGDDEFGCTFPPPAFACPQTSFVATVSGTCTVLMTNLSNCTTTTTANYCLGVAVNGGTPILTLAGDDL